MLHTVPVFFKKNTVVLEKMQNSTIEMIKELKEKDKLLEGFLVQRKDN